jgi:hypothetical protein
MAHVVVVVPQGVEALDAMFCGCGRPDLAWEAALAELKRCGDERVERPAGDRDSGEWWVLAYLLSHLGLTEHGSSVASAWLDDPGREAITFLEKWGCDWQNEEAHPAVWFENSKGRRLDS